MAKKAITVRLSNEADLMLKKSAEVRQTTQTNVMEQAIRLYFKKEKLDLTVNN